MQRADGADLAVHFHELVAVSSETPTGGRNTVEIAVCSIPALLAMKGYVLELRQKRKDAYDIHYCIRNYPGGVTALADDCKKLLGMKAHEVGTDASMRSLILLMGTGQPVFACSLKNPPYSVN